MSSQDRLGSMKAQQPLQHDTQSSVQAVSSTDVIRYRYHHGTNCGSVFILEQWLAPGMFPQGTKGTSELAAAQAWANQEGLQAAQQRFENHWSTYISDDDLSWLRDVAKCTTIRLPIGYFTLGPPYCNATPFQPVSSIYTNAWSLVKSLVSRCAAHGIGVLIDLHGLPGGANDQDHSGTDSGKVELWGNQSNLDLATRCICFIAQQASGLPNISGIQIVNEAVMNASGMYDWYDTVLAEVAKIEASTPIYVSDGWDLNTCLSYTQKKNNLSISTPSNPVVVDTHLYWCFSPSDEQLSPQQIISVAAGKLSELDGKDGSVVDRGAAQAFVGEYSCVLADSSWAKSQSSERDQLVKAFGQQQSQRYQARAGGSTFWTYRMDWMPGGEWGFRDQTQKQDVTAPPWVVLSVTDAQSRTSSAQAQRTNLHDQACSSHAQYWDSRYPGTYEHWRFNNGWDMGWDDAVSFFGMRGSQDLSGGDKIGMLDLWCLKRVRESGQSGKFLWEFEQGLRQGIADFYSHVGI